MIKTNYDELLPKDLILLSVKDVNDLGIINSSMCRKLIYKHEIEIVKIGSKNFIPRSALIRYLEENTIPLKDNGLSA